MKAVTDICVIQNVLAITKEKCYTLLIHMESIETKSNDSYLSL